MNAFELDKIDHIAIQVSDINKSVKWYTSNYKCNIIYADSTWAFIEFDNIKLSLVANEEHPQHFAVIDNSIVRDSKAVRHRDGSISKYKKDIDNNYIEHIAYPNDDLKKS